MPHFSNQTTMPHFSKKISKSFSKHYSPEKMEVISTESIPKD
jgi:hypothetical protein